MEYINIGEIVTTHGLKGEIKIRSNFKYKKEVFKKDNYLYLGANKKGYKILNYRSHKEYDMVILENIDDIEKAIPLKKELVYFDKSKLILDNNYLNEDLVGLNCFYEDNLIGIVSSITNEGSNNEIIRIKTDNKEILIPNNDNFIEEINLEKKRNNI